LKSDRALCQFKFDEFAAARERIYWLKPVVVLPNGEVSAELPINPGVLAPIAGMERLIPKE
jgi:hypothetical protein